MVAIALARDDSGQAERTLGAATRLSLLCGLASAALQIAFGARILATYTDASSRALPPRPCDTAAQCLLLRYSNHARMHSHADFVTAQNDKLETRVFDLVARRAPSASF